MHVRHFANGLFEWDANSMQPLLDAHNLADAARVKMRAQDQNLRSDWEHFGILGALQIETLVVHVDAAGLELWLSHWISFRVRQA